jgi:hypothetical protein
MSQDTEFFRKTRGCGTMGANREIPHDLEKQANGLRKDTHPSGQKMI